jgi:hypothetical protein
MVASFAKFFVGIFVFIPFYWGFFAHRTISQLAVYYLPEPLNSFYYTNMKQSVYLAVEADVRRKADSTEATKHYLDMDADLFKGRRIPKDWNKAVLLFGETALRKEGSLPWEIEKVQAKLTTAMQQGKQVDIIALSADLSHYLADATVPLHTTKNYDGQLTDQVGLHELWETMCPEMHYSNYIFFRNYKAKYIKNTQKEIWSQLNKSYKMLPYMLEAEKKVRAKLGDEKRYTITQRNGKEYKKYSGEFAKEYQREVGTTINDRLLEASTLVADFWYTCWVNAGKPDLKMPLEQELFTKEYQAWRNNELVKENLLRAKNGNK